MTPHWHALQNTGAKSTSPVNAERPGVRQSSGAFLSPIRFLKFVNARPWRLALFGQELRIEGFMGRGGNWVCF